MWAEGAPGHSLYERGNFVVPAGLNLQRHQLAARPFYSAVEIEFEQQDLHGIGRDAGLGDQFVDSILKHFRESIAQFQNANPVCGDVLDAEFLSTMATGTLYMYVRRIIRENRKPFVADQLLEFRRRLMVNLWAPATELPAELLKIKENL